MAETGRRQFCAALVGGSVVLWLSGCGGDPDEELEELDGNVRISSNHGHALVIPAEDLNSLVTKFYDIRGAAGDHTHVVSVDSEQFRRIKEGQVVAIGSSAASDGSVVVANFGDLDKLVIIDSHTHTVTSNPAV